MCFGTDHPSELLGTMDTKLIVPPGEWTYVEVHAINASYIFTRLSVIFAVHIIWWNCDNIPEE